MTNSCVCSLFNSRYFAMPLPNRFATVLSDERGHSAIESYEESLSGKLLVPADNEFGVVDEQLSGFEVGIRHGKKQK